MDDENDLARRQAALRNLAQSQTQQPATGSGAPQRPAANTQPAPSVKLARSAPASALAAQVIGRPSRGGRRRRVIIGVALLVIVVVVAGAAVGARIALGQRAAAPAAKPVLRINAPGDGLACIMAVAWSPDGKQIAAQGDTQQCGGSSSDSRTGAIYIYDAQTGRVVQQLQPDQLIFNAPAVEKVVNANVTQFGPSASLFYQGLTWTPDGQALIMGFNVEIPTFTGNGPGAGVNGLLRLAIGHTSSSVVWTDSLTSFPNGTIERWDLSTGKSLSVPTPPAATNYRWNSDGTLSPAGSAAGKPIGAPNRGQAFSIWQAGQLQFAFGPATPNSQPNLVAQDIQWAANFTPISPDGRYFYSYFPAFGSLVPPSTKHAYPDEQIVEPHDAALVALARHLSLTQQPGANQSGQVARVLVTWRPDGRLLAAIASNDGSGNGAGASSAPTFAVSVYDTSTGKLVKQVTPSFTGMQVGSGGNESLVWSPDGSRLLLVDNIYGAITIWGPGALPTPAGS